MRNLLTILFFLVNTHCITAAGFSNADTTYKPCDLYALALFTNGTERFYAGQAMYSVNNPDVLNSGTLVTIPATELDLCDPDNPGATEAGIRIKLPCLPEGVNTVYFAVLDTAGNWHEGTVVFTVIVTNTPIVSGPSSTYDTRPTWTWQSGGEGDQRFRYSLSQSGLENAPITTSRSFRPSSHLSAGYHTLYVQETNPGDTWSPVGSFRVRVLSPQAPNVASNFTTYSRRPTWTWSLNTGGDGNFRYKLDNSNLSSGAVNTRSTSFTPSSDLSVGNHALYVQQRNAAGNWSATASTRVTINVPPAPNLSGVTPTYSNRITWNWSPSISNINLYRYKLNNSNLNSGATTTTARSYSPNQNLAAGVHTLYLQQRHTSGAWSSTKSFGITILKPLSPNVSIGASTYDTTPTWTLSSRSGGSGTYRVKLNSNDFSSGFITTTSKQFTPTSHLNARSHTLYAQERNAAGDWSNSGSASVTVLAPKPPVVGSDFETFSPKPTWTWAINDGGNGTYRFKLNDANLSVGSTTTTGTSYTSSVDLPVGSHTLFIQQRNGAGDWSANSSITATIKLASAPVVSGPNTIHSHYPTWTWVSGGGGVGEYRYKLNDNDMENGAITSGVSFTPSEKLFVGSHTLYVQERSQGGAWSAIASKIIQIINNTPVAGTQSISSSQDISIQITNLGSDGDNDQLTYEIIDGPSNGSLTIKNNDFVYRPDFLYHGSDTIKYKLNDGFESSGIGEININVVSGSPLSSLSLTQSQTQLSYSRRIEAEDFNIVRNSALVFDQKYSKNFSVEMRNDSEISFTYDLVNNQNYIVLACSSNDDVGFINLLVDGVEQLNESFSSTERELVKFDLGEIDVQANQIISLQYATNNVGSLVIDDLSFVPKTVLCEDVRITSATSQSLSNGDQLSLVIPASVDLDWSSDTSSIQIVGSAASKVSHSLSFDGTKKICNISILSDFLENDFLTISGLKFQANSKSGAMPSQLKLSVNSDFDTYTLCEKGFISAGPMVKMGVKQCLQNQSTKLNDIHISNRISGEIFKTRGLVLSVPSGTNFIWDHSQTIIDFSGSGSDKVNHQVEFSADNKKMYITINENFTFGESLIFQNMKVISTVSTSLNSINVEDSDGHVIARSVPHD